MTNLEHEDGKKENVPSFELLINTEDYAEFRIDKSIIGVSQSNDGVTFGYRLENQPHLAMQKITIPESQVVEIIAYISMIFISEGMKDVMKEFTKEFPLAIFGAAIGMAIHASTKDTKDK